VADYYDILGVERDASTDEIRTAYRARLDESRGGQDTKSSRSSKSATVADAAALNQAWNVLADPFQRRRYDEQLRTAEEDGTSADVDGDEGDTDASTVPARRGGVREAMQAGAERRAARGQPVDLPNGLTAASSRDRINALIVDALLIYIIAVILVPLAFSPLSHDAFVVKKAGSQVGSPHKITGDAQAQSAQKAALLADEKAKVAKETKPGKTPAKVTVSKERVYTGGQIALLSFSSMLAALCVVVPSSAITGQTLGKKIFRVRLTGADGGRPGWRLSFLHYAPPILLAVLIPTLGPLLALGLVLWFLRDPLRQGLHDKLAKTFVVAVPRRTASA
jgi:RDD family/DnaJ domain